MESEQPITIDNITARPDRRKRFYNSIERSMIDPFKDAYMKAKDAAERRHITVNKVFPPLFTHWEMVEKRQLDDDERKKRIDDLLAWIRNNWRLNSDETLAANFVVKSTTVLWLQRRDEVFEEIATLLGVPKADTSTKGWFGKRMEAMGNILNRMSASEKQEVDDEAARILREGYDDDQKRRLAKKYAAVRMNTMAVNHWLEMGLISFSFVISATETGQLGIEIHDQMAEMMGLTAESFETKWPDEVQQMERLLTNYVRHLRGRIPGILDANGDAGAVLPNPTGQKPAPIFEVNNAGYPIVPANFVPEDSNKLILEDMFRRYLSLHYKVATNGRTHQVPYADVTKNMRTYIDKEYLPKKFVIKEPRSMKVGDLKTFFKFVLDRQHTQETAKVFRYRNVSLGRPKKIITAYVVNEPDAMDEPDADADAVTAAKQKKKNKKKRGPKSKSNGTLMMFEDSNADAESTSTSPFIANTFTNTWPK
ncbi:hypothetical protein BJ912DRAFT_928435 [Pholiota molesta]|nr:hypothetical protein BJ912DRAFT_928435 [Pholiota molesta]